MPAIIGKSRAVSRKIFGDPDTLYRPQRIRLRINSDGISWAICASPFQPPFDR
jgi:hypothetical protein